MERSLKNVIRIKKKKKEKVVILDEKNDNHHELKAVGRGEGKGGGERNR